MYLKKSVLLLFLLSLFIFAVLGEEVSEKCRDNLDCIESEYKKYLDSVDKEEDVKLFGDFVVLSKKSRGLESAGRDEGFLERCARYLSSHELKVRLPIAESSARSITEGRTKKLRKILLPLLLLLKLKAAIVIPAVLSVVALVAFKGLGAGLTALAIAGAVGFKTLLEGHQGGSKLTYEVVPQLAPHWSRAGAIEAASVALPQGYHTIA